jgi:hypothetical protein
MSKNELQSATALMSASDDGWNAPIDESNGGRTIVGELLRYDDKTWYVGKGKEPFAVEGNHFLALAVNAGWKIWQDGKPVEFVREIDGRYPLREELGHLDETKWEVRDGEASDPCQDSREVLLIHATSFAEYTFCTATVGGRSAVDRLKSSVRNARRVDPDVVPMVTLGWEPMPTKHGKKTKPLFRVVGWRHPKAGVISAGGGGGGGMNDPIPFAPSF